MCFSCKLYYILKQYLRAILHFHQPTLMFTNSSNSFFFSFKFLNLIDIKPISNFLWVFFFPIVFIQPTSGNIKQNASASFYLLQIKISLFSNSKHRTCKLALQLYNFQNSGKLFT